MEFEEEYLPIELTPAIVAYWNVMFTIGTIFIIMFFLVACVGGTYVEIMLQGVK